MSEMNVSALVCGIISVVAAFIGFFIFGIPLGIVSILLGVIAMCIEGADNSRGAPWVLGLVGTIASSVSIFILVIMLLMAIQ